jgi:hypothetical protein
MRPNVSLRTYWILLSVFFTLFALVLFELVSYGFLEYNLGVNLFTSSIFMVLTIVFLNFLFTSREQNEWKTVKDEVHSMIQMELGAMFDDILNYIEDGFTTKNYLLSLKKKETRKEAFLSALSELKDAKELKLNDTEWKLMIEGKISLKAFSLAAQTLNEVEIKYSRFLSSQLTLSLIKIQNSIRMLDTLTQLHASMMGLSQTLRQVLLPTYQEMEKEIPKILSHSFKKILEETYNIHKMGIEFSPYPI